MVRTSFCCDFFNERGGHAGRGTVTSRSSWVTEGRRIREKLGDAFGKFSKKPLTTVEIGKGDAGRGASGNGEGFRVQGGTSEKE